MHSVTSDAVKPHYVAEQVKCDHKGHCKDSKGRFHHVVFN